MKSQTAVRIAECRPHSAPCSGLCRDIGFNPLVDLAPFPVEMEQAFMAARQPPGKITGHPGALVPHVPPEEGPARGFGVVYQRIPIPKDRPFTVNQSKVNQCA